MYKIIISIFDFITIKFYYYLNFSLDIFFKIDKSFKISYYYIILSFDLIFDLNIKDNKEFLFNFRKILK